MILLNKVYIINKQNFLCFIHPLEFLVFYWIVSIYIFKYIFNYSCTVSRFYLINTAEQNNLSFVIVFKNFL